MQGRNTLLVKIKRGKQIIRRSTRYKVLENWSDFLSSQILISVNK